MSIILVIICPEQKDNGSVITYISHGINIETGETVILPQEDVRTCNFIIKHPEHGYILRDPK